MTENNGTTNLNDLPNSNENILLNISEPTSNVVETNTINELVSGIQDATGGGVLELPSRDISQKTTQITNDEKVKVNYIPKTEDYIKQYENMLLQKQTILNRILLTGQQQISNTLAGDITPERRAAAKRRRTLKQLNGVISEDARIQGMVNRPCFTKCEKKSWCDPTGWCDTNYYCTPSNREGTASESDMKIQKCVPVSKKSKGGKRKKTKKSKKLKRKRKTYKRKHRNKKRGTRSRKKKMIKRKRSRSRK